MGTFLYSREVFFFTNEMRSPDRVFCRISSETSYSVSSMIFLFRNVDHLQEGRAGDGLSAQDSPGGGVGSVAFGRIRKRHHGLDQYFLPPFVLLLSRNSRR